MISKHEWIRRFLPVKRRLVELGYVESCTIMHDGDDDNFGTLFISPTGGEVFLNVKTIDMIETDIINKEAAC